MVRQAHHVRFDKFTMIIKSRITLSLSKGDKLTMIIKSWITLSLSKGDKLTMITLSPSKDGHAFYKVHQVSVGLCR
jgi:hypothetical protein